MPSDFSRKPGLVDSSSRSSKRESPMAVAFIGDSSSCLSNHSSTSAFNAASGEDFGGLAAHDVRTAAANTRERFFMRAW